VRAQRHAGPSVDGAGRWSREHRASCGERMRDLSGPRARVSASQQRRLEVDMTRKRDVQTGGPRGGPRERQPRWLTLFFLGVGFPVVNWESIYIYM
jgi:hypothetical protein